MTLRKNTLAIAAIVSLIGVPGAIAQMQGVDMQKMMQMLTPAPNDPASTKDFKQAHMDMMKDMNMEFTGNPDVDFAKSMIKHHEGGIEMAKILLKHGKDPEMRKKAEKLIKEQGQDNKEFQAWLKKHSK
jgi:uncharacterized protein (DUF305 family)